MDKVARSSRVMARFLVWHRGSGDCLLETHRIYVAFVIDVRTWKLLRVSVRAELWTCCDCGVRWAHGFRVQEND